MTFRELTPEFMPGGQRAEEGTELLKVALSFNGFPIGIDGGTAGSQGFNIPLGGAQS